MNGDVDMDGDYRNGGWMVGVCEMCRAFVLFSVCLLMIGLSEVCLAILVDYRTLVNVSVWVAINYTLIVAKSIWIKIL